MFGSALPTRNPLQHVFTVRLLVSRVHPIAPTAKHSPRVFSSMAKEIAQNQNVVSLHQFITCAHSFSTSLS